METKKALIGKFVEKWDMTACRSEPMWEMYLDIFQLLNDLEQIERAEREQDWEDMLND
jgi:hypothetical protein